MAITMNTETHATIAGVDLDVEVEVTQVDADGAVGELKAVLLALWDVAPAA